MVGSPRIAVKSSPCHPQPEKAHPPQQNPADPCQKNKTNTVISKVNNNQRNNPTEKQGKDWNRYFTEEDIQMANEDVGKSPTLSVTERNVN